MDVRDSRAGQPAPENARPKREDAVPARRRTTVYEQPRRLPRSKPKTALIMAGSGILLIGIGIGWQLNRINAGSSSSVPTSASKLLPTRAGVGGSIVLTSKGATLTITLVKVVDPATLSDDVTITDKTLRPVAVQIRVVNTGRVPYAGQPLDQDSVTDAQGQSYGPNLSFDTDAGPSLPMDVALAPGEPALGAITFLVPKTITPELLKVGLDGDGPIGVWTIG